MLEMKSHVFKDGIASTLQKFGIPLRDKMIQVSATPPKKKHGSFRTALQYPGKPVQNVHKKVIHNLRTTLRGKINEIIGEIMEQKKRYIKETVAAKAKSGELKKKGYAAKLEKVMKQQLWRNYDQLLKETAEFTEDVLPLSMVKKVLTHKTTTATTQTLIWEDTNPGFLFECWDNQLGFWERIKWRADHLNTTHDCWTNYLGKLQPPKSKPTCSERLDLTRTILGREVTVDGKRLRHILPPEKSQVPQRIHLLACEFCLKTGHTQKNCVELKNLRKKKGGKEKKFHGHCHNCGNRGHQEKWCRSGMHCTRCNSNSHKSEINNRCPVIRAQKATNQRIQILLTHSQQPVSRRMMKAYVHWFNSRSKTEQIETDKGDKKKRKRKVKKGPSKRTIIDLEEAKENDDGDNEQCQQA